MIRVMHQSGDWALVLKDEDTYMVRHVTCGGYLRHVAGCSCRAINLPIGQRKFVPIGEDILKMYLFVTEGK